MLSAECSISRHLLLTAMGKAEAATIFEENKMPRYITEIVQKDLVTFAHPGPEQDILFDANYDHATNESKGGECSHCDPDRILSRQPREIQDPVVHYAREVLSFVPAASKEIPLAVNAHADAATVLDVLLLTRPEVDWKPLIALKGHRVDRSDEWVTKHHNYQ